MTEVLDTTPGPEVRPGVADDPSRVAEPGDGAPHARSVRMPVAIGLLALVPLVVALALVRQEPGPSAASHFALIRALPTGTAEIGPGVSIDSSYINGRYYANKAPGLAFATLPFYLALREAGAQDESREYASRLWQITLFGALLPALALALLMFGVVERVVPGYGALSAVLVWSGTLLLPFSTLLFGHVLSALLGFAAFAVLLRERRCGPSIALAGAAGLLAGLAVVVEYPLGIVAVVLAAYVATGTRVPWRVGAYAAGCLVGILPLLAYNTWAFGSPTTLSYSNVITGVPENGAPPPLGSGNSDAFYGVALPDLRVAVSLLLSEKGLLVVAPLVAVALAGLPELWRSGRRPEAAVCAAVPAAFLAYNAAYYIPFGGQGPGPRFLVPALPFLALPLAVALRRRLFPALTVCVASIVVMTVGTATNPLTGPEHSIGRWISDVAHARVVPIVGGLEGRLGFVPFAALLGLALVLAVASARPSSGSLRPSLFAAVALGGWIVAAVATPRLLPADATHGTRAGMLAAVLLVGAVVVGLVLVERTGRAVALALVPLGLLVLPAVHTRQQLSLLVALSVLGLVVLVARRTARRAVA